MQVKKWLEQVNRQLPNLSKNLFILFNHWDQVVDDEEEDGETEDIRSRHLQDVGKFLVQGLQANAILDRTFFVSGREACKARENEKNGEPSSAGIVFLCIIPFCYYICYYKSGLGVLYRQRRLGTHHHAL